MGTSDPMGDQPKPKLFAYSLILPSVWIAIGLALSTVAPGFRLGIPGSIVMFTLTCVGICWLILRRHGRMPTKLEAWRLVAYCSVLAVILESWVLLAALTWPEDFPDVRISRDAAVYAIAFTAVVDTLIIALAIKVAAPRYLKKVIADSNNS